MKLGLQFRYQTGQVQVNHNHFLGYTKNADGNLIIDPEQAEVVKRWLERITVWEDHFTVELKSELKIDIDE